VATVRTHPPLLLSVRESPGIIEENGLRAWVPRPQRVPDVSDLNDLKNPNLQMHVAIARLRVDWELETERSPSITFSRTPGSIGVACLSKTTSGSCRRFSADLGRRRHFGG